MIDGTVLNRFECPETEGGRPLRDAGSSDSAIDEEDQVTPQ